VHVLAALPVPAPGATAEGDMLGFLTDTTLLRPLAEGGVGSAFVQLAYPWHLGLGSGDLPGGVEPPDGVLAGVLARSALARGSHRSVAAQTLMGGVDTLPRLGRTEQLGRPPAVTGEARTLIERVTLLGPTPRGMRLLSDVTTSADESYRPASVSRIVAALIRACQHTGAAAVFEASGAALWTRVRESIERVLLQLFEEGALHGRSAAQAYRVRCDRSTMNQHDLDNGRVVVEVTASPAAPIEHIVVALAVSNGGQVSVAGLGGGNP
jgi:phage tail sheath protein FI